MKKNNSAGVLLYRFAKKGIEYFLIHPGGPFWKNKDLGSWSIPKGEYTSDENPLDAARREFREETGHDIDGDFIELTPVRQKAGKLVQAWAVEGDINPDLLQSNSFEIEWPPRSGKYRSFPEVDKAAWFNPKEAKTKINPAQWGLLEELDQLLSKK
jgi:predicted NUDIX family NTP pyrophosphohydrolase